MAVSSQGLLCYFNYTPLTITSMQVSDSAEPIDASTMANPAGSPRTLVTGYAPSRTLDVDVISNVMITAGTSGDITIGGTGNFFTYNGVATVQSSSLTGRTDDVLRGSLTFVVTESGGFLGFG